MNPEQQKGPRAWDLAAAAAGLTIFRLARLIFGLPRVYATVARWRVNGRPGDNSRAVQLVSAVEHAAPRMPWRCVCMDRSVVETVLLRREGFHAQLALGGRLFPLGFHAWVQMDGKAVNEPGGEHLSYSVMDVI